MTTLDDDSSYKSLHDIFYNIRQSIHCNSLPIIERLTKLSSEISQTIAHLNVYIPVVDPEDYEDDLLPKFGDPIHIVKSNFSEFGYYNLCLDVTTNINHSELMVGDAIDDICSILLAIEEFNWRYDNFSKHDAYLTFHLDYSMHLAEHFIGLQYYILHYNLQHFGVFLPRS